MAMRSVLFLFTILAVLIMPNGFGVAKEIIDKGIVISDLKAKVLAGTPNGALYVKIQNCEDCKIILHAVKIDPVICRKVELHDHVERVSTSGVPYLEMIEIPAMEINPGTTLKLIPGSKHIMLMGIDHISYCREQALNLTFCFRKVTGEEFEVAVDLPIDKKTKRCEG